MHMTCSSLTKICNLIIILMLIGFLSACAFVKVSKDNEYVRSSTVLVGVVSSMQPYTDMPVVVAAYSIKDRKRTIIHYTTLHEVGPYELMVPLGTHNLIAFGDKNKNLVYDKGEPVGQILRAEQVSVPAGGVAGFLDIVLTEDQSGEIDFPVGSKIPPKAYKNFHSTCPGALADLDDVVFSDEYGKKGFWTAVEFFNELSGNVYFLEPYDPNKIPILFVHGAAGSPQNWRTFFESVDRNKFQPWFFYYPSGSHIDSMAYLLFWKLQNLQTKYNFKELYITAHSMGGLVCRSFLVDYGFLFPSITNFITLSTPWGGEELAEMGITYAPAVINAWRDMQPESDFITSIFDKKLPASIDHYLFFGHKGNRNLLRPNNDKVVTLASQLDQRSQMEAKMIYGYNEDHLSILSSYEVISQYNALLADMYRQSKDSDNRKGNRLVVDFTFDFPKELPRPLPLLLLRPIEGKQSETWLYLGADDTGRVQGPFPSGKYEVSVFAPAFRSEPISIPVKIEEGAVPAFNFIFKPIGYLRGYIVDSDQPNIQAGKHRPPDEDVQIESISLTGRGGNRSLKPWKGEDMSFSEIHLSETDYTSNGVFFFFGLLPGEYQLDLKAKGYKKYSIMYKVELGQYQNPLIIELEKEAAEVL